MCLMICKCPSYYNWTDEIIDGKSTGYVYLNDEIAYGITHDSTIDIIIKMAQLVLFTIPVVVIIRMPCRIISLLSGDFLQEGRKVAKYQLLLRQQNWEATKKGSRPSELDAEAVSLRRKLIGKRLVINVFKILLLPGAAVLATAVAVYGIFVNALDARAWYAKIEHAFSPLFAYEGTNPHNCATRCSRLFTRYSHYLAPCMLPIEIWDLRNLFVLSGNSHPETIRSTLSQICRLLDEKRTFFEQEFTINERNLSDLEARLDEYKRALTASNISPEDSEEFKGTQLTLNKIQTQYRSHCVDILASLNKMIALYETATTETSAKYIDEIAESNRKIGAIIKAKTASSNDSPKGGDPSSSMKGGPSNSTNWIAE